MNLQHAAGVFKIEMRLKKISYTNRSDYTWQLDGNLYEFERETWRKEEPTKQTSETFYVSIWSASGEWM